MFNLGFPELVVVGAAVLLLFGPKRLPDLLKGLGKGIRDFKRALDGVDDEADSGLNRTPNVTLKAPELEPPKKPIAVAPSPEPTHS